MPRMILDLNDSSIDRLDDLGHRSHSASHAIVIAKALAVFEFLCDEKEKGGRVLVRRSSGKFVEINIDRFFTPDGEPFAEGGE